MKRNVTTHRMKLLVALMLTLMMVVTMTPVVAFADNEPETGVQQELDAGQDQELQSGNNASSEGIDGGQAANGLKKAAPDNWAAFDVQATLQSKVKIGQTATYSVTVRNTTNKSLTLSWMNNWYYASSGATGIEFGTFYSGGNPVANDGKGITFSAGQSRSYVLKGKVPSTWKNGKSCVTIVIGAEKDKCYGQADVYSTFDGSGTPTPTPTPTPTNATTTGFRVYKSKSAYVSQSTLSAKTKIGSMIRSNMVESQSHAIPGLENTFTGQNVRTFVPQGLCSYKYKGKNYYLISAYDSNKNNKHKSVIYVLDTNWKFVKNITLPNKFHNGGIAYDPKGHVVWFTGDTGSNKAHDSVACLRGSVLDQMIASSGKAMSLSSFDKTWVINNAASCLDFHNGRLWVGTCDNVFGKIIGYKTSGTTLNKNDTISVSGVGRKLNGFTFGNNNDIYLSYSVGRDGSGMSKIDHRSYSKGLLGGNTLYLSLTNGKTVTVPRMNEEVLLSGSYLYVMYESAATEYLSARYMVTDRVTAINKSVWSSPGLNYAGEADGAVSNAEPIQLDESVEVSFEYNADAEVDTKETALAFTPDQSGSYNVKVELLDEDQDFYVTGGVVDADSEEDGMILGELCTAVNNYGEEGAEAQYADSAEADINLSAGHTYDLRLYAASASEAEGNTDYAGTYKVTVTQNGDISTIAVAEGSEEKAEVWTGSTSCFEFMPGEAGTYLIDWKTDGELAGCTVTDEDGNAVTLNDNHCDLQAGKTYYFSSTLIEGGEEADAATVQFGCSKLKEAALTPGEDISVANDTILNYHAEASGRQIATCSYDSDEVRLSAYDSKGDLIGVGGNEMIFETEPGTDYRITCTGLAGNGASVSVDPYVADIGVADITLKNVLTYKKGLKAPALTVFEDQVKLVKDTDYTLAYDKKATDVGKHKVTVKGVGKYQGVTTVSYEINPASTTLSKVKPAKKAIKVTWKKQSMKMKTSTITGYEVQLATNKAFTKGKKTIKVKGYKKTSVKAGKLKAKKKYYVRVRTYKTVSGKKYYSPWSKVKTAKTK